MARALSSQKRLRQSKIRGEKNKARKTQVKSAVRKVRDAIQQRDSEAAEKAFREASKLLDRNGNRKTIHPNAVARRKSRLAKRINELKSAK